MESKFSYVYPSLKFSRSVPPIATKFQSYVVFLCCFHRLHSRAWEAAQAARGRHARGSATDDDDTLLGRGRSDLPPRAFAEGRGVAARRRPSRRHRKRCAGGYFHDLPQSNFFLFRQDPGPFCLSGCCLTILETQSNDKERKQRDAQGQSIAYHRIGMWGGAHVQTGKVY